MDVHCSTCGEPWDVYHVRHDAIFETHLSLEEAEAWRKLPTSKQLTANYREVFRGAGWEFGRSILNVIHCPCCPKDAKPDPQRLELKSALEDILGDDGDGLASTFEEHGL